MAVAIGVILIALIIGAVSLLWPLFVVLLAIWLINKAIH